MNIENQNIEYKESWRDEYLKWICGFANAQGGSIYIGIDDDGQIVGIDPPEAHRLSEYIPNKVRDVLGFIVDVNLKEEGDKTYLDIVVEPQNIPVSYKGQYHYRSGSTKQELKGNALQQFLLKRMGRSWEDLSRPNASMNAIDENAVRYFVRKGIECGRMDPEVKNYTIAEVLQNMRLIDDEGALTNAALVLFGKDTMRYCIGARFRIGRFKSDASDLISQDEIVYPVIEMADRVMEVLKNKYLTMPIHYVGMQRQERLEIPEDALREVLYNAIIHKDYTGADIQMKVFDDRIELWNEGTLPTGYDSMETLLRSHMSKLRNPLIAGVFFRAGFVETWGRGYEKIHLAMTKAGLKMPTFEYNANSVCVTILREQYVETEQSSGQRVAKEWPKEWPETKRLLAEALKRNPSITIAVLEQDLGKGHSIIKKYIKQLQDEGLLTRRGSKTQGYWEMLNVFDK